MFLDEEPLVSLFFHGSTKREKIVPCCTAKLMVIMVTNCAQSKMARLSKYYICMICQNVGITSNDAVLIKFN